MGKFLDLFPRTIYKLDGGRYSSYDTVTNITFRVGIIREVMNNLSAYYEYVVRDGDVMHFRFAWFDPKLRINKGKLSLTKILKLLE